MAKYHNPQTGITVDAPNSKVARKPIKKVAKKKQEKKNDV